MKYVLKNNTLVCMCLVFFIVAIFVPTALAIEEKDVTLNLLIKWPQPDKLPYFQDVVKNFEKENPNIKINMEAVADEPIKDKLRIIAGGTLPDIFFSWGGQFVYKFVEAGLVLDLTPYFEEDVAWETSFATAFFGNSTFDGRHYGVPFDFFSKFFTYNIDIFDKYNLDPPEYWDEFLDTCETLKNNQITPIIFGNQRPFAAVHYMTTLNQKMVPEEVRKKDYNPISGEFTHPGYIKALEYLKLLQDNGYFNEGINTMADEMANQLFYDGQAAMKYMSLPYYSAHLEANMPGKWDIFPMPIIPEGEGNQNIITGASEIFCISSQTKYPDEAVQFLKFLTNQENAERLVKELGLGSCVIEANNEDTTVKQIIKLLNYLAEADGMEEWLDTALEARIADIYLSDLQLLLNDQITPEDIMKEVQTMAKLVTEEQKKH